MSDYKYRVVFVRTVEPDNKEHDKQEVIIVMGYYKTLEDTLCKIEACEKLFAFRSKKVWDYGYLTVMPMEIDDYVYPQFLSKGEWVTFLTKENHSELMNEENS